MTFRILLAALLAGSALAQSPDDLWSQGIRLTASEAQVIEESLRADAEDLAARGKLLAYYFVNQAREPWSEHVFWLIEHHPESPLAGLKFASGALPADPLNGEDDRARARDLWLEQTRQRPDDALVQANAARFLSQPPCDGRTFTIGVDGSLVGGSAAPFAPTRIRVGSNLQAALLIKRVEPDYPRQDPVQGTVRFTAIIGTDGHVQNLQVISGHPLLIPAAMDTVRQWIYRPTLLNGKPVEVVTTIDVPFTLPANR